MLIYYNLAFYYIIIIEVNYGGEQMADLINILNVIKNITMNDVVDIVIVAYLIYKLFTLIKETRAEQLIKGLILLIIVTQISYFLELNTLYWLIKNTLTVGVIAFMIIFQPELRRALEHLGRSRILTKKIFESEEEVDNLVDEVAIAAANLSETKTGALMVIEQETGLNDFVQSGVKIDAVVSSPLLENIFVENTPLHDGAVIIRKGRIVAAACVLPLTEQNVSKEFGTRHRASIGVTENSDAIAVVVSEETGIVSLSINGKLTRNYSQERLKTVLSKILKRNMNKDTNMFKKVRTWLEQITKK